MKGLILLVILGLLAASLSFAAQPRAAQTPSLNAISLPAGKNPEGMTVNPVTHKAYVAAEVEGTGNVVLVFDNAVLNGKSAPKIIPVADETEYLTVDSTRNLIYLSTRFGIEQEEEGGGLEPPGALVPALTLGTLTVIDGNYDTVIATYQFPEGEEPEGVAVDSVNSVVYVGVKAPEPPDAETCSSGTQILDPETGEVECWTAGSTYAFFFDPAQKALTYLKSIPAGDDPESVVFANGMVYAGNEDDGTITIATAVKPDGSGGDLVTDLPTPLTPYSLHVFSYPNPLACADNKFEVDKMAVGGGSVFVTDDRSRVAKITGAGVVGAWDVPGATVCLEIPNTDGGGANTANNIAFLQRGDRRFLYVVSEQNTVAIFNPATMELRETITIPEAKHLDAIGIDSAANRVWITDEDLHVVFVLQGAATFDFCLQDESTRDTVLVDTSTGDFLFTRASTGEILSGFATVLKRGSTYSLTAYGPTYRVLIQFGGSTARGTGSFQMIGQGITYTIVDRNIFNNSCM